ncbi:hypothetical protein E2C01_074991 [Portunus trituberculatus]|uniref:Uncharacterized protein n=1 Tax=Portunus trituberculatus TaxID=210409 RepID=A0A5B7I9G7_PORTR|nr:hypothetical protein [Portunus trituberculatus]
MAAGTEDGCMRQGLARRGTARQKEVPKRRQFAAYMPKGAPPRRRHARRVLNAEGEGRGCRY